jgi:7-cyano-7-deazaguanine synthase
MSKKYAVLSLSGGMDSSTLLLHLLNEGYDCTCLSFDYGQKHKVELERATDLVKYLNSFTREVAKTHPSFFPIKHQIIKLDGLAQLLNSSLVEGGAEVPEGHYAEENMKDTVVPNRNKIFSSIIQAVALSISNKKEAECVIALGVHSGDHSIYPDCTEAFRNADEYAFKIGNWDSELVNYYTPYMEGNKFTILEDGVKCCDELGLDFDEVYKRTNTSYKPIYIPYETLTDITPGKWYSDYKSASSVERVEAFMKLGRPDPVKYADENGPVVWQTVVSYVSSVLENHGKETSNN